MAATSASACPHSAMMPVVGLSGHSGSPRVSVPYTSAPHLVHGARSLTCMIHALVTPRRAQRQLGLQRQVVRHRVHGRHGVDERHGVQQRCQIIAGLVRVLGQPQQHAGGAQLERLRHVHAVGVADDHVQATIIGWAVGFVARVDDGAFEGGLQSEDRVDVVGTLAELVSGGLAALPYADAAGSGVYLP